MKLFFFATIICVLCSETLARHKVGYVNGAIGIGMRGRDSPEKSQSETSESKESTEASTEECIDPNAYYVNCASDCPQTCDNYWINETSQACKPGCVCKAGFVLDENNKCVRISSCTPNCFDPRKEFHQCGSACPNTCKNYQDINRMCTMNCVTGCFCKHPYVLNDNDICIEPTKCPPPCPKICADPNREYKECATACPDTCDNYQETNRACTKQCVAGCFCKSPLVLDKDENCVDPSQCPSTTSNACEDPNKEYKKYGTGCPDTCDNCYDTKRVCNKPFVAGCFCKSPLVLDASGNCIDKSECPSSSTETCNDPNSEYQECGPSCVQTCNNRCTEMQCPESGCVEGCFCKYGFIDDGNGNCVPPSDCPDDACQCSGNAQWTDCGTCDATCDATCEDQSSESSGGCKSGCYCRFGMVRDKSGVCIPKSQCGDDE